jgi:putative transposase
MPDYRRFYRSGGTYFFTVVTEGRAPILCEPAARNILRTAIDRCRKSHSFELIATVLLPDHLHAIWKLPDGDIGYSERWASIKAEFTTNWVATGGQEQGRSASRVRNRRRGIWQRRFWEHVIRDEDDFERHLHYIHFNPVKHGLAKCPHDWTYSTFQKWVKMGIYEPDWSCVCNGRQRPSALFDDVKHPEEWGE